MTKIQKEKRNTYQRQWHKEHPEATKKAFDKCRNRMKKERNEYLAKIKSQPCSDCNKQYHPICMDFDHRDRKTKLNSVSKMGWSNNSLQKIKLEIDKCDLVCANCHRLRTYKQFKMSTYND